MLKGLDVLGYYASEEGGVGIVSTEFGGLDWSHAIEKYLSPHGGSSTLKADGDRFFIGACSFFFFVSLEQKSLDEF